MPSSKVDTAAIVLLLAAAGCTPVRAPGMAAASPATGGAASPSWPSTTGEPVKLLVAFPATACTGSESAVFVDESGRFLGSVAPGTTATLTVGAESQHVLVVSSLEVAAPPRASFLIHEVPRRSDQGVIVQVPVADSHNCQAKWAGPLTPRPTSASLAATSEAAKGLTPLEVRAAEGNRWLDEHRDRVNELLGVSAGRDFVQPVVSAVRVPR